MDLKEIKEIIKIIDSSNITEFQLDREGFKLAIKKEKTMLRVVDNEPAITCEQKKPVAEKEAAREKEIEAVQEERDIHYVKSPIVGTFYSAPSPEAEAFVKVGSRIKKGEVLCIIEAMKLMNEVTSDVEGEIVEILAKNKDLVEYGQPLFKVRQV